MESVKLKLDHDAKQEEVDSRDHATGLGTTGGLFAEEGFPSCRSVPKEAYRDGTHSSNPEIHLSASLLESFNRLLAMTF